MQCIIALCHFTAVVTADLCSSDTAGPGNGRRGVPGLILAEHQKIKGKTAAQGNSTCQNRGRHSMEEHLWSRSPCSWVTAIRGQSRDGSLPALFLHLEVVSLHEQKVSSVAMGAKIYEELFCLSSHARNSLAALGCPRVYPIAFELVQFIILGSLLFLPLFCSCLAVGNSSHLLVCWETSHLRECSWSLRWVSSGLSNAFLRLVGLNLGYARVSLIWNVSGCRLNRMFICIWSVCWA